MDVPRGRIRSMDADDAFSMHDENLKIVTDACRQDTIDALPINKGEKLDFIGFDRAVV